MALGQISSSRKPIETQADTDGPFKDAFGVFFVRHQDPYRVRQHTASDFEHPSRYSVLFKDNTLFSFNVSTGPKLHPNIELRIPTYLGGKQTVLLVIAAGEQCGVHGRGYPTNHAGESLLISPESTEARKQEARIDDEYCIRRKEDG